MDNVLVDFNNLRNAEMLSFDKIIIQHINKNANFTAPVPSIADFVTTTVDYKTALTRCR